MKNNDLIEIATSTGMLKGFHNNDVMIFKGIPYAHTPDGSRRFKKPLKLPASKQRITCQTFGNCAPQVEPPRNNHFSWLLNQSKSTEDCLNLNIYAPTDINKKIPVMVYFHGGAYSFGSATAPAVDGRYLAKAGKVVVITVNHRLGIFAHLSPTGTAQDSDHGSANAGILDLIESLHWIQENIAAFNGDPSNITIFGQSGGAGKVAMLMRSPLAKGLFHKAILQSTANGFYAQPEAQAQSYTKSVLKYFGLSWGDFAKLREKETQELLNAMAQVKSLNDGFDPFRPTIDNKVIFEVSQENPLVHTDMPILIGCTETECTYYLTNNMDNLHLLQSELHRKIARFTGFSALKTNLLIEEYKSAFPSLNNYEMLSHITSDLMFKSPSFNTAEKLSSLGLEKIYTYLFSLNVSERYPYLGSPHTIELPFIFGTLNIAKDAIDQSTINHKVMQEMMLCWSHFAYTGKPYIKGVNWPAYNNKTRETMVFDKSNELVKDPFQINRSILSHYPKLKPGSSINFIN